MTSRREKRADGFTYVIGPDGDVIDRIADSFKSEVMSKPYKGRSKSSRRKRRDLLQMLKMQGGQCFYCNQKILIEGQSPEDFATIDEVEPRSRGGLTEIENQVAACWVCNNRKGNRMPTSEEMVRLAARNTMIPDRPSDEIVSDILDELDDMEE